MEADDAVLMLLDQRRAVFCHRSLYGHMHRHTLAHSPSLSKHTHTHCASHNARSVMLRYAWTVPVLFNQTSVFLGLPVCLYELPN